MWQNRSKIARYVRRCRERRAGATGEANSVGDNGNLSAAERREGPCGG